LRPELLAVYRWARTPSFPALPEAVWGAPFWAAVGTETEWSLVLPETVPVDAPHREPGWRALGVEGPLDFSLVGILAGLAGVLAREGIALFAVSTFDTDYLLVKADSLDRAVAALRRAGHEVATPA
jgi:hypothetical protein